MSKCVCFRCFSDTVKAFGSKQAFEVASYECSTIDAHRMHHDQLDYAVAKVARDYLGALSPDSDRFDFSLSCNKRD